MIDLIDRMMRPVDDIFSMIPFNDGIPWYKKRFSRLGARVRQNPRYPVRHQGKRECDRRARQAERAKK